MKSYILYCNCHAKPLRKFLETSLTFSRNYQMVDIPFIQDCPRTGLAPELLHRCDLFIYMRTSDAFGPNLSTDYLLGQLPQHCMRISIGNSYFTPYYPQLTANNKEPQFAYPDQNIIRMLREGKSRQEIMKIVSDEDFYTEAELEGLYADFMYNFRIREIGLDIPIAPFIDSYYQQLHLFSTICHPRTDIIRAIAKNILQAIGIPPHEVAPYVNGGDFTDLISPIYPSVIKHLKLQFAIGDAPIYALDYTRLNFEQYMHRYITYHQSQLAIRE
ncbi:WcbI family polysaccharide biosynthesis putative acetyltransferase [Paenibacillus taiwanensis]|uniref:WcbI family polysaccharide biosynthesis putative acetyltransferase n=1 Tax=Paenibacillus taiwanensis TaxID=401638 RepID=UPI00040F8B84|nr:WcbI family polysaccharide biosynthesis putative acetyltransferase [Paenibacillus taiwanensis]